MIEHDAIERQMAAGLAKLTPENLADVLDGLGLEPDGGIEWFAAAVRGALYTARMADDESPERKSNAETRDELNALAEKVGGALVALSERSSAADSAIWDYAARDGGIGEPPEHAEFNEALGHMHMVPTLMRRAAMMLDVQSRGWRLKAQRDLRVRQAKHLAVVYHLAFGKKPSAHTRPAATPPPWPILYERIIKVAFGLHGTNDIPGILDEAAKGERVTIAAGFIPDKPL